jgi:hypothetical protein
METPYRLRARKPPPPRELPLGALVGEYRAAANAKVLWATAPFGLLILYGAWLWHQGRLGTWVPSGFSQLVVLVLFVLSIALIVNSALGGAGVVQLFEHGVVDRREATSATIHWQDLASLTSAIEKQASGAWSQRHVVTATDGTSIVLTSALGGLDDLLGRIRWRLVELQLPGALEKWRAGGDVRFGAVVARPEGIAHEGTTVAWAKVTDVDVDGGALVVTRADGEPPMRVPLVQVPNAAVLAALVDEVRKA